MEEKIKINSKLGLLEIDSKQIINFIEAPLGYSNYKSYALLEDKNEASIFLWLQAIDKEELSFPVLEVEFLGYSIKEFITNEVTDKLNLNSNSNISVYTIVSIPEDPMQMTANFKGPIIINNDTKTGLQTILNNANLDLAKPIFVELSSRLQSANDESCNKANKNTCKEVLI